MSDFYKCEHGEMVCGSCIRGLKVQHNEMESKYQHLEQAADRMAECLKYAGAITVQQQIKFNKALKSYQSLRASGGKAK